MDDLYAVLGVAPDATAEKVRAGYVAAIRRTHPDTGNGDEETAKRLTAAYAILRDEGRRAVYDRRRGGNAPEADTVRNRPDGTCEACGARGRVGGFEVRSSNGSLVIEETAGSADERCQPCALEAHRDLEARRLLNGAGGIVDMLAALGYRVARHTVDSPRPEAD